LKEKKFLTRQELVSQLCLSLSTVDRGLKQGSYPFNLNFRIGRRILFPVTILDELLSLANKNTTKNKDRND
jgi:hypothetical protein